NLIVSHHPRPNASYPADLLSHCFPGPLPPNPFICHTCRKSPRKPNHCHRSETALPQLLSLPHIQDPLGVLYVAQPFPFPEESVKKPGGTGTPVFSLMTSFTGRYQDILYTSLRRGLREKALVRGLDGMGNGGHRRAAGAFCGEREPWGKNDAGTVPGIGDLATHGISVVAA